MKDFYTKVKRVAWADTIGIMEIFMKEYGPIIRCGAGERFSWRSLKRLWRQIGSREVYMMLKGFVLLIRRGNFCINRNLEIVRFLIRLLIYNESENNLNLNI